MLIQTLPGICDATFIIIIIYDSLNPEAWTIPEARMIAEKVQKVIGSYNSPNTEDTSVKRYLLV